MNKQLFRFLFGAIAGGEIIGRIIDYQLLDYIFKPLLLPVLAVYFWFSSEKPAGLFAKLILGGLLLSWAGDVFLMFSGQGFFIAGLLSFLAAHVLYTLAFWKSAGSRLAGLKRTPWALPIYTAIVGGLFLYLQAGLGVLQIPVLIYASVLGLMSLAALNRRGRSTSAGFGLIYIGSLFFMISDSILAVNKFAEPLPYAGLLIMSTYIVAQFLITEGALAGKETEANS